MFTFETITDAGHEGERILTAFYRFLERKEAPPGAHAAIHTEILGPSQRCVVQLWSKDAVADFESMLRDFHTPSPSGLVPPRLKRY